MGEFLKTCCKSILVALNTLVLLVSLAILGTSIYLIVEQYRYELFGTGADAMWAVWTPFGMSLFLVIVALGGCCVAMDENKCCLIFYGLLQLIFGIIIILAGSVILVYSGYMVTIADTPNANSLSAGLYDTQWYLSDYTTGMFQQCCNATLPGIAQCGTTGAPDYCYHNYDVYLSGLAVPESDCSNINDAAKDANLVMCDNTTPVASTSNLKNYQQAISTYTKEYFNPAAIAFCVFGAVLLVAFLGSSYIACCYSGPSKKQAKHSSKHQPSRDNNGAPLTMA